MDPKELVKIPVSDLISFPGFDSHEIADGGRILRLDDSALGEQLLKLDSTKVDMDGYEIDLIEVASRLSSLP